jgi:hypothetical protein
VTPTHEQVLAAIDKAEAEHQLTATVAYGERRAFCAFLRATAERHAPREFYPEWCNLTAHRGQDWEWPCPDYRQVIDQLTAWGFL